MVTEATKLALTINYTLTGLLSPPGNVAAQQQTNSVIVVSWQPPPTLDLTDIEPDISHYEITVYNSYTGYQSTADVNGIEYMFQPDTLTIDECTEYGFSVLAVNVVGRGESIATHTAFKSKKKLIKLICTVESHS